MLLEPGADAVAMEPVAAGQDSDLVADFDVVHADGTFGFAVGAEHGFVDGFLGEGGDGGGGGGAWGGAAVLLLH